MAPYKNGLRSCCESSKHKWKHKEISLPISKQMSKAVLRMVYIAAALASLFLIFAEGAGEAQVNDARIDNGRVRYLSETLNSSCFDEQSSVSGSYGAGVPSLIMQSELSIRCRRVLQQGAVHQSANNSTQKSISTLTGKIPRRDPIMGFKIYSGGFNVTDKHYWSSVSYTGIWGYLMAFFCALLSILYGIVFCCGVMTPSVKEGMTRYQVMQKNIPLFCICQFSFIAIVSALVIYVGNARLGQQLRGTATTFLTAADDVQQEINSAVQLVQVASMFPISHQGSSQEFLQACISLGNVFNSLQRKVKKNKDRVYKTFDNVKIALTVISAILTIVVIGGSVGTFLSLRGVLLLIFGFMTLLLFATWLLAGVSFVLNNVANDACQIMRDYDQNPENSSISQYLPCLKFSEANKALGGAKEAIKSLVTQSNAAIDWVNREEAKLAANKNSSVEFILPKVCDPYGPPPSYNDTVCGPGDTSFSNFSLVYAPYRCNKENLTYCFEVDTPIPSFAYAQAEMAMNASDAVYKMLPTIFKIITCNFVKVTFEDILLHHCKPLQSALTTLWGGFILASLSMMPLQLLFALLRRQISSHRASVLIRPSRAVTPVPPPSREGTPREGMRAAAL